MPVQIVDYSLNGEQRAGLQVACVVKNAVGGVVVGANRDKPAVTDLHREGDLDELCREVCADLKSVPSRILHGRSQRNLGRTLALRKRFLGFKNDYTKGR